MEDSTHALEMIQLNSNWSSNRTLPSSIFSRCELADLCGGFCTCSWTWSNWIPTEFKLKLTLVYFRKVWIRWPVWRILHMLSDLTQLNSNWNPLRFGINQRLFIFLTTKGSAAYTIRSEYVTAVCHTYLFQDTNAPSLHRSVRMPPRQGSQAEERGITRKEKQARIK